jgi:transketolase
VSAIMNGIALRRLHSVWRHVLTFSDYSRNAVRMAALMRLRVIFVLTRFDRPQRDGPTHQPMTI